MLYRKKTPQIRALQWVSGQDECEWIKSAYNSHKAWIEDGQLHINTISTGVLSLSSGDYLVFTESGGVTAFSRDVFELTFEEVTE